MVPAWSLFIAMSTQWRWVGAGMGGVFRTGLDYGALPVVAAGLEVPVTADLLHDLRTLEGAAVEQWGRR